MSTSEKINLLNFDRAAMQAYFASLGEKSFRGDQLFQWIHQHGLLDFAQMTNFSKSLRQQLSEQTYIELPEIRLEKVSTDGTHKWLLGLQDNNSVEMVFIPERNRGTLCISSQVGCALDCSFCSTGKQGFSRNLSIAEIIGQVWLAVRRIAVTDPDKRFAVTNVVLMGMGEPLLNFDHVVPAMQIMMDDLAYGLSKYRVTLSTSGLIPAMLKLRQISPSALAVSLHAPNDTLRNVLVPINKKYPLKELMTVCRDYYKNEPKRVVTFEYVMLKDVNDQPEHALELAKLLRSVPCKVNLIPFNPFPLTNYECSPMETIRHFQSLLQQQNILVTIRKTRGDDIDAACGQLVGQFQDRTQRNAKWLKKQIKVPVVLAED